MIGQTKVIYKYTWTQDGGGALNIGNDIAPTDATVVTDYNGARNSTADLGMDVSHVDKIYALCDTLTDTLTNASTFDFKLIGSPDGTIYSDEYLVMSAAQLKNKKEDITIETGPQFLEPRLDVNVANVDGVESVTLYVYINKR